MADEKLFTQEEINEIIQDRLARAKRKHEEELEKIREELPEGARDYKKEYHENLRKIKLIDVGFSFNEADRYAKYITAEEPEQIEQEANLLAEDVLPGKKQQQDYADPGQKKSVWNPFK
jgi:hypothetical protein